MAEENTVLSSAEDVAHRAYLSRKAIMDLSRLFGLDIEGMVELLVGRVKAIKGEGEFKTSHLIVQLYHNFLMYGDRPVTLMVHDHEPEPEEDGSMLTAAHFVDVIEDKELLVLFGATEWDHAEAWKEREKRMEIEGW